MQFIAYYSTARHDEMVETLSVKTNASLGWTAVYEIIVAGTQANDILTITGRAQVTNNLHKKPYLTKSNNVALGSCLGYVGGDGGFNHITYWTGGNVDAIMHHVPRLEAALWQIPANVPADLIVRFYMKTAALQAKSNWKLEVDTGLGYLRIKHERP